MRLKGQLPADESVGFELRILGPVRAVRAGQPVPLGGAKQRAVLALLLVEAGRAVPAESLAEALWCGSPPPGAAKTLRSYVSRLRTLLEPDAGLVARGGGYVITVEPDQVDAARFERLVAAGQAALSGGEAATAGNRFQEALGLWRGRALADVCEVESLALEAARLEELRLAALEGRLEAEIELGRHAQVTGELERLVAEHPLRERLWRLLMLALYRGERQADALAAYRRARQMLAGELGIEPGEELRALEEAVLQQKVPPAPLPARHNLPAPVTSFVDREQELGSLDRLLGEARLVTLTGMGGVGKTRLALEAAAGTLARFADGAWLADLAPFADSEQVPAAVMEALGVRQEAGMAVMEALGYRLRSADLLLVLDNCEHLLDACAQLVSRLLRGSPGLQVLATSREPLGLPGEVAYPVRPLPVDRDPADVEAGAWAPAVRLFLDRGWAARGGSQDEAVAGAVAERICRTLDGLPLAIELAAARMGTLSAADVEAQLADRFAFLAYRRPAADPRHQALQAAMDWSYQLLSAEERRVFAELSVFAGSFGLKQAAAVCAGGDQAAALDVVDRLAGKSLVATEPAEDGTRYRLLETVRQYGAARLSQASGTKAARRRHGLAFLALAERERGQEVLSRDLDNFRAALEWSLSGGDESGPRLARALGDFWLDRGLLAEGRNWLERALAQHPADQCLRANLLRLLGTVLERLSRYDEAIEAYQDALAVAREPLQRAHLHVLWGAAEQGAHRYQEALGQCDAAEQALGPAPERPEREWLTTWLAAQDTRMWVLYWMGDTPESGRLIERVRPFIAVHGSAEQRANFFTNITMMSLRRDRFFVADKTLGFARAAYAAAQEAESPYVGPVWPVFTLGFTLFWRGDLDEATEMLRDSLQEAERRGDATIRSRSLTYLMAAMRKRGDLDGVRKAIGPVIEWAREASLPEYEAMALANRAWAEWRAGEDENAATDALTALEMWEGLPVRYPVDWMALWPLIALALAFQRTEQAVEYARRMLHPPQQLLQEPVPTLVGKAVHAWDENQSTEAEELLRGAMRAAGDLGYL